MRIAALLTLLAIAPPTQAQLYSCIEDGKKVIRQQPCPATEVRNPEASPPGPSSRAAALEMVKRLRLGENMKDIGLQAASRTQTYAIITKTVGPEKGRAVLAEELQRTAPKYQGQWDQNLASAYAPLFTAEELQSITQKQRQSPHFSKFMAKQDEVGAAMRSRSVELLKQYVTEVMTNAFRRVAPAK